MAAVAADDPHIVVAGAATEPTNAPRGVLYRAAGGTGYGDHGIQPFTRVIVICARARGVRRRVERHPSAPAAILQSVTADSRITNWTERIDGAIKAEVIRMHHHKSAWTRVSAMLAENADLPDSYWWEFMFEIYAMSQAFAVRRQADARRDVNSASSWICERARLR
jgi:hypothetical protein